MAPGKLHRLPRIWTLSRSVEMSCLMCLRMVLCVQSVQEPPGMAPRRLRRLHRKWSLIRSVRILLEGRWRGTGCTWSTLVGVGIVIRYVPYSTRLFVGKFVFSIGGLKDIVMFGAGLLPLICASGDDV